MKYSILRNIRYINHSCKLTPIWKALDVAISLEKEGKRDEAIDAIFNEFDEQITLSNFETIDVFFEWVWIEPLTVDILLALLVITLPAKSKLPARENFYNQVEQEIIERGEMKEGLLDGLK